MKGPEVPMSCLLYLKLRVVSMPNRRLLTGTALEIHDGSAESDSTLTFTRGRIAFAPKSVQNQNQETGDRIQETVEKPICG
jgi:hypothetical protein